MLPKDLLNLVFLELIDGHTMINFSEISRKCHQIFCRNINIKQTTTLYYHEKRMIMLYRTHGILRGWEDDHLTFQHNYLHGQRNGLSLGWYPQGQRKYVDYYINDHMYGRSSDWYSDGTLRSEYHYHRDQKHGICRKWDLNGELEYTDNYCHGKLIEK